MKRIYRACVLIVMLIAIMAFLIVCENYNRNQEYKRGIFVQREAPCHRMYCI